MTASRGERAVTLYAGPRALGARTATPRHGAETTILFTEQESIAPHVRIERDGDATQVSVEMTLLDRLESDPGAQQTFLEIFQLVHDDQSQRGVAP